MTTATLWQVGPDGTCTYPAPLPHVRFAFPVRGTCHACGMTDVCGRLVGMDTAFGAVSCMVKSEISTGSHLMVCAGCTMTGRA